MNNEQLLQEWEKDQKIDKTDLTNEGVRISELQVKYLRFLDFGRRNLYGATSAYNKLYLEKRTFFIEGPDEVSKKKGWEPPARGKILVSQVDAYLNADSELASLEQATKEAQDLVDDIKTILDTIKFRGNLVGKIMDWEKYTQGS